MSKEIYAPVGGKAQKITKLYAPVNGVARSVKKVYKGVGGVARQVFEALPPMAPVFADNTWADIILACQLGTVPDTWTVGAQKSMTINGKDYVIDIIGKNHDDYADGSGKAPLTFQMHDLYTGIYKMNETATNSGGWRTCTMRTGELPAILTKMPDEVQAGIREVNKRTGAGGQSGSVRTTADKLFLLSVAELFGAADSTASGEGTQYAYYAAGNSKSKKSSNWWTRSPDISSSEQFRAVTPSGGLVNSSATGVLPISFAFCF